MEDTTVLVTAPATLREHVAEEILALLGRRRMSKASLARRLGHANQMQLERRLQGKVSFTMDELNEIARILGVEVRAFFPATPASSGQARPVTLDDLETISALVGIPPADLINKVAPSALYLRMNDRPKASRPTGRRTGSAPATPRPFGHPSTEAHHAIGTPVGSRRTRRVGSVARPVAG
jgi:transcriptional regulator with XRE-family HTH domain